MGASSSGRLTASTIVFEKNGDFDGVEVITDGTNNATITVYDGTDAGGKELFYGVVKGSSNFGGFTPVRPITCADGLYVVVSGTGASCIVYYLYGG